MALDYYGIRPSDWIRDQVNRQSDANHDGSIAFRLWFIGSSFPYARVNIATTTHDFLFRQGPASAAAQALGAGTSAQLSNLNGKNPVGLNPTGGAQAAASIGFLHMGSSAALINTMFKLVSRINVARDWCAALIDSLPTDPVTVSAGNGVFLTGTTTANDGAFDTLKRTVQSVSTTENLLVGANVILDTSLKSKEFFYAGVTLAASPTKIPCSDVNVLHEILEVRVKATYATTGGTIDYSLCDDKAGTVSTTFMKAITAASTATEFVFGSATEPIVSAKGKRIVFRVSAGTSATTASLRAPYIKIVRRSYIFGPSIRARKTWAWVNQAQ